LIGKFKSVVTNILSQLNQNEVDYNTINFDELNDSLEKAYKLLLDEIVLPYEKIDLTDINSRLNKLEDDLESSIDDKRGELDELAGRVSIIEDVTVDVIRSDIDYLKDEVKKNVTIPNDLNEKRNSVRDNADMVSAIREDSNHFSDRLNELDDNMYDRRNEIEHFNKIEMK
jgi:DNA repair exonuclease SbcCD ATPase subunit